MKKWAYYNEIDPFAAQWVRELIKAGLVAPGEVDERSIEDVRPDDVKSFMQCHWFAGVAVWSHALRLAGWGDNRPVWTASCPCQPFSAAGKSAGFDDERHLWPAFYHLLEQCRPAIVFGEQVDAAVRSGWWDLVASDAEAIGYAAAASIIPASAVGAPHIRHRLWFVLSLGAPTGTKPETLPLGKDLHEMPTEKTDHGVLQREEVKRRPADGLQGVLGRPQAEADKPAEPSGEDSADGRAPDKARRGGTCVLEEKTAEVPGQRAHPTSASARKKEGLGVRFGPARVGTIQAGGKECLRDDGTRTSERNTESVEQPVPRPNTPHRGLRLWQHSGGLLRPELRAGYLGSGAADGDINSLKTEGRVDDSEYTVCSHDKNGNDAGRQGDVGDKSRGAPHIRDRAYWVADTEHVGHRRQKTHPAESHRHGADFGISDRGCTPPDRVADANGGGQPRPRVVGRPGDPAPPPARQVDRAVDVGGGVRLADSEGERRDGFESPAEPAGRASVKANGPRGGRDDPDSARRDPAPTNGFWRDADWLGCRDGKWRPVEPGTFPLVNGVANRVGLLRGYGNAVNAQAAAAWISAYLADER